MRKREIVHIFEILSLLITLQAPTCAQNCTEVNLNTTKSSATVIRVTERIMRIPGKSERLGPLTADSFQGLETYFGKLLLVCFTRPLDLEALDTMRPLGC